MSAAADKTSRILLLPCQAAAAPLLLQQPTHGRGVQINKLEKKDSARSAASAARRRQLRPTRY